MEEEAEEEGKEKKMFGLGEEEGEERREIPESGDDILHFSEGKWRMR